MRGERRRVQATGDLDAGGGKADAKPGDGLSAIAFGLGGDGASPDDDEVGRRAFAERDEDMSLGQKAGLLVEGLRAVQPAAECQKRDFHVDS